MKVRIPHASSYQFRFTLINLLGVICRCLTAEGRERRTIYPAGELCSPGPTLSHLFPLRVKEWDSGERKRRLAPRLSPYQTSSTFHIFPASSHALANALQAASRSKNVKLFFRRKAGRQLHVIADLPSPPADRASACRPPRTRHRHLAGRRGRGGRRTRPPHTAI